jgi:hypothetical protein
MKHKDIHVIHIENAQAILNYLIKQPYAEVFKLIPVLQQAPQLDAYLKDQEEKEKTASND